MAALIAEAFRAMAINTATAHLLSNCCTGGESHRPDESSTLDCTFGLTLYTSPTLDLAHCARTLSEHPEFKSPLTFFFLNNFLLL